MKDLGQLPTTLRKYFCAHRVPEQDRGDLVQETLLRVLRCSREEPLTSVEAFSIGVAKRVLSEYWRRAKKGRTHQDLSGVVGLAGHSNQLADALEQERALLCRRVLSHLPERMTSLLVRRFVDEVPGPKIAREEGISTNAIDIRVYEAKREFREQLQRECRPHTKKVA